MWAMNTPLRTFAASYRAEMGKFGLAQGCVALDHYENLALRNPKYTLGEFIRDLEKDPLGYGHAAWCLRVEGARLPEYLQELFMRHLVATPGRCEAVRRLWGEDTPEMIADYADLERVEPPYAKREFVDATKLQREANQPKRDGV